MLRSRKRKDLDVESYKYAQPFRCPPIRIPSIFLSFRDGRGEIAAKIERASVIRRGKQPWYERIDALDFSARSESSDEPAREQIQPLAPRRRKYHP